MKDVQQGLRTPDVLSDDSRLQKYNAMDTRKMDVSSISAKQAANFTANETETLSAFQKFIGSAG